MTGSARVVLRRLYPQSLSLAYLSLPVLVLQSRGRPSSQRWQGQGFAAASTSLLAEVQVGGEGVSQIPWCQALGSSMRHKSKSCAEFELVF